MRTIFRLPSRTTVLSAICALVFAGSATPGYSATEEEKKKHLDWDATDKIFRCVGSPVDCDTGAGT